MSSKSWIIDTKESMLIVDEQAFPINLGTTTREDLPEGSFRLLAYNGKNILPTALGYRNFFSDSTLMTAEALPSEHCQVLLAYQTPTTLTQLFALCEQGMFMIDATNPAATWNHIYDSGYDPEDEVRHQWSWAVVANKLCAYQQGMEEYVVISDLASVNNMLSQATAGFPDADLTKIFESIPNAWGILEVQPTFLNMGGQIGLFRANNRLGFWDSDNATAWSSATQIFDFVPSTETFAGITTFADVQGSIVKILGHGDSFIIYATRSVVLASSTAGSPERFAGRAIFSDTGVSFDTEVASGQPDTTHYALVSSGLAKIERGTPEFIHTPISDYLQERTFIVSLQVVDGRYLFLYTTEDLQTPNIEVEVVKVVDSTETEYNMRPTLNPAGSPPIAYYTFENPADLGWQEYRYEFSNSGGADRWEPTIEWAAAGIRSLRSKATLSGAGFGVTWAFNHYLLSLDTVDGTAGQLLITATIRVVVTTQSGSPYLFIKNNTGNISGPIANGIHIYEVAYTPNLALSSDPALLFFEFLGGQIGQSGGSAIFIDELKIIDLSLPAGLTVPEIISGSIDGAYGDVQLGLGNFEPTQPTATPDPKLLMPCYSGGKFNTDWMYPEFTVGFADGITRNIPLGLGLFSSFEFKLLEFNTGLTSTGLGPSYRWADAVDRDRYIDQAGQDFADILTESFERLQRAIANTVTATSSRVEEADDWIEYNVFGSDILPYPTTAELIAAGFPITPIDTLVDADYAFLNTELAIENVLKIDSVGLKANECRLDIVGQTVNVNAINSLVIRGDVTTWVGHQGMVCYFWETTGTPYLIVGKHVVRVNQDDIDLISAAFQAEFPDAIAPWGGSIAGLGDISIELGAPLAYVYLRFPEYMTWVPEAGGIGSTSKAELTTAIEWCLDKWVCDETDGTLLYPVVGIGPPPYDNFAFPEPTEALALYRSCNGAVALTDYLSGSADIEFPTTYVFEGIEGTLDTVVDVGDRDPAPAGWDDPGLIPITPGFTLGGELIQPSKAAVLIHPASTPANQTIATYKNGDDVVGTLTINSNVFTKGPLVETRTVDGITFTRAVRLPFELDVAGALEAAQAAYDAYDAGDDADRIQALREEFPMRPSDLKFEYKWRITVQPDIVTPPVDRVLIAAEITGYGHFNGGNNFRKTHVRVASTTCPIPGDATSFSAETVPPLTVSVYPLYPNALTRPPVAWPYPGNPVIPDVFALYREGSYAPFYPLYKAAVFWDIQLDKWGRYDKEHLAILSLLPVNRADPTVLTTIDKGLRGASLRPDGMITNWAGPDNQGRIDYGRIGNYRLGVTKITHVTVRFAEKCTCQIIIEPSIDGAVVEETLSLGVSVIDAIQVEIPFTMAAKWFNIRIEGQFNLVGISFESEARGRR